MSYKRFLIFSWDIDNHNIDPVYCITATFDKMEEVQSYFKRLKKYEQKDFSKVFDCDKREVILDQDNIPF